MNRRQALSRLSGVAAAMFVGRSGRTAEPGAPSKLGLVIHSQSIRQRWLKSQTPPRNLADPFQFLERCLELGAGGMQVGLGVLPADRAAELRNRATEQGLFLEADIALPKSNADVDRFEAQMETAVAVGARAARCVMFPGRRYEQFDTLAAYRAAEVAGRAMVERAAPVAERLRLPLAIENHKDQRIDERVALLRSISSEYVGACVDTGNSVALLDDALETVRALAPWARAVHLKDQALRQYEEGFLLGDIPLGQGCLPLREMIAELRRQQPGIPMALELITRDPLQVPCLTDRYWATFPELPARDLARTLRLAGQQPVDPLPAVSTLPIEQQVALEEQNVRVSVDWAAAHLPG